MSRKRQSHLWAPTPDRFNLAARKSAIDVSRGSGCRTSNRTLEQLLFHIKPLGDEVGLMSRGRLASDVSFLRRAVATVMRPSAKNPRQLARRETPPLVAPC